MEIFVLKRVFVVLIINLVIAGCATVKQPEPEEQVLGDETLPTGIYYAVGEAMFQAKDYEGAAYRLKVAANRDHSDAQSLLGQMYLRGTPATPKNYELAHKWLQRSANANNSVAQYNLGYMFSNGVGVNKNIVKANELYKKAAELGHASAQMSLAMSYLSGTGIEKNQSAGCSWMEQAIDNDPILSKKLLSFDDPLLKKLISQCNLKIASR